MHLSTSIYVSVYICLHLCTSVCICLHLFMCLYSGGWEWIQLFVGKGGLSSHLFTSVYICCTSFCICLHVSIRGYGSGWECPSSVWVDEVPSVCFCLHATAALWMRRNTLQHTATHYDTLQHICNTLQHTATHCNTLQHTAAHLQHTTTHCSTSATHCNTLQHTAQHCNTATHLQHTWH